MIHQTDNLNFSRIEQAIRFLTENVTAQPDLDEVAAQVHLSPFHFQRLFTDWAGISPKRFLQFLTTDFLKNRLVNTSNLLEATDLAGLSSPSRVHDLFVTLEAVTPNEYKTGGENVEIAYGFHETPFGKCFIAVTERGICGLSFIQTDNELAVFNDFKKKWANADFEKNEMKTALIINQIFNTPPSVSSPQKLHLLVKGTNFQVKVWEALLKIPTGGLSTYQTIAELAGSPNSVRAVGTAVGSNPIAYLIPCHRVIRKEGKIGEYHWGENRKKALIGFEMAQALSPELSAHTLSI